MTAGDIIALCAMVVSIVFGVISITKSRKAKKSEEKAAVYAKNADGHNEAAKDYYEKMSERLDKEDLTRRIERVYNHLWENTKEVLGKVMDGKMYVLSKDVVSVDKIGAVELRWLYEYLEAVDYLNETEAIKEYISDVKKAVDDYIEAWQYSEKECRDAYEIIVENYYLKLVKENEELSGFIIEVDNDMSGWFILYEMLNTQNFLSERLMIYRKMEKRMKPMRAQIIENALNPKKDQNEIDKIKAMLSRNSSDIRKSFFDAIEKEYSLIKYYEKVKSTLIILSEELEKIIVNN